MSRLIYPTTFPTLKRLQIQWSEVYQVKEAIKQTDKQKQWFSNIKLNFCFILSYCTFAFLNLNSIGHKANSNIKYDHFFVYPILNSLLISKKLKNILSFFSYNNILSSSWVLVKIENSKKLDSKKLKKFQVFFSFKILIPVMHWLNSMQGPKLTLMSGSS